MFVYRCTNVDVCLLIFILKTDIPRFSCDISIHAKDNCFCCGRKPYHYYSTFRVISVIFYYIRICPRRIYVHLLVHVCLVNIQNLVQPLSFQCLYQKHNHLKSYITNNFTVQAPIGGHLCYVTITYTAIQYTVIKYLNDTAFWYLLF